MNEWAPRPKDPKIRNAAAEGQTFLSENLLFALAFSASSASCQDEPRHTLVRNLMPLLFRARLIGKKHTSSMYGSRHSDCDASSVGEASVSLLPPARSPAHQESNNKESSWKRQAWCMACLAFTMAAVAGALGAYVIFMEKHNGVSGGSLPQAARGPGGGVRRPLPLMPKSDREPLKPP